MRLKKAVFYILLIVGVGFCIGGVFVPVLFPVGSACILGAVAVGQNLTQQVAPQPQAIPLANPESNPSEIDVHIPRSDENLEVDLHIAHRQHYSIRGSQPSVEPDECKDVDSDHDAKARPNENIHKRLP